MEDKIYAELKAIKALLSKITGTADLPAKDRFSSAALDKAAKKFKKLSVARGVAIGT